MIVSGANNKIERGGTVSESMYKIKAAGKAFKILSDGLYSDKPLAIIRELSCNAFDAHVAAGKTDVPFSIHLPNHLEPYLTIRDEGTGLSDFQIRGGYVNHATGETMRHEAGDDLMVEYKLKGIVDHPLIGFEKVGGIFTTYFESTKTESNDFIGALGLGSKSPFSYVDSYTIISRHNGKKLSYTAFIAEDDCPAIALLGEDTTDETNGLEISMPVRSNDFRTFEEKARLSLAWFDPQPIVTGARDFQRIVLETQMSGTNWRLVKNSPYGYHNAVAVMGRIAYPIDAGALGYYDLTHDQRAILQAPFVIEFDIGELEFAASRESLSYKPGTIAAIKKAVDVIVSEVPSKFQSALDDCKTLWEARSKFRTLLNENRILTDIMYHSNASMTWQGNKLKASENYFEVETKDYPNLQVIHFNRHKSTEFKADKYRLTAEDTTIIFVDDIKRGGTTRTQKYHREERGYSWYHTTVLIRGDEAEVEKLLKALGNPSDVRKTSTLPKPERLKIERSAVKQVAVTQYGSYSWQDSNVDEFEVEAGGLYIPFLRDNPVGADDRKIQDFMDIISYAREFKILDKDEVVYGLARSVTKQIKDNDDWKNIIDVLKERFAAHLLKQNMSDKMALQASFNDWHNQHYYEHQLFYHLQGFHGQLGDTHALVEFHKSMQTARSINYSRAQQLATYLGIDLAQSANAPYNFSVKWDELQTTYPMLSLIRGIHNAQQTKLMVDYVQTVDKAAAVTAVQP